MEQNGSEVRERVESQPGLVGSRGRELLRCPGARLVEAAQLAERNGERPGDRPVDRARDLGACELIRRLLRTPVLERDPPAQPRDPDRHVRRVRDASEPLERRSVVSELLL